MSTPKSVEIPEAGAEARTRAETAMSEAVTDAAARMRDLSIRVLDS
jgi:hypothetical protein